MEATCLETDCTIEFEGRKFTSGGAFIGVDKNGKHGGRVYADWNKREVSNWSGTVKVPAIYGRKFRSNFDDLRRHIWFTWKGINFHGLWCSINWSELVNVKEVK